MESDKPQEKKRRVTPIFTAPFKAIASGANFGVNISKNAIRHRKILGKTALSLGIVGAGGFIADQITTDRQVDKAALKEKLLIDQDIKRGSRCLSDGLRLPAGTVIRDTPASINNGLGRLSVHTGLFKGNIHRTIEEGKEMIVRQPRYVREDNNEWAFFTEDKLNADPKTIDKIAKITYAVDLRPFKPQSQSIKADYTYDIQSTPPEQGFTMPCQMNTAGQTTVDNHTAAYGATYTIGAFDKALNLQK
jgi:hypothetical protein